MKRKVRRSSVKSGSAKNVRVKLAAPAVVLIPTSASSPSVTDRSLSSPDSAGFPVVGIGASAGGLEAFRELLAHLPADTGMGFVLVQHLNPDHKSALPELLAKVSRLPVEEVTRDLRVEPNHVYVIPPNHTLVLARGILKLRSRPPAPGGHRSIDSFFESLAADRHEGAIGIILSGTASDGTLGLEAIKAAGGITFAQDESAKYDSMPRSAIAAGVVDFVLSPAKIAEELAHIANHPYVKGAPFVPAVSPDADQRQPDAPSGEEGASPSTAPAGKDGEKKILLLLARHTGVDFTFYKSSTIRRRIRRRMVLNKLTSLEDYANFLRGNSQELDLLYSDVLIHVTSFFRNPEAFDFLKHRVFPQLIREQQEERIRIWVPGCSTGQEAYSIAMALSEVADRVTGAPLFQVFATDLNAALLETARIGLYTNAALEDVSPERLRRFFTEEQGGFRICKPLRDLVVFAQQNLLRDPPFSRMSLICCRNLLIYLEPSLQKKIFSTFHYALKPMGFLFLGAAESVSSCPDFFEAVSKKNKVFLRKPGLSPQMPFTALKPMVKKESSRKESPPARPVRVPEPFRGQIGEIDVHRESDRVTLNRYAPCSVLVNAELQVLQFRGDTSPWLKPPLGKASFNVLKMAREGLLPALREALGESKKTHLNARREKVRIEEDGLGRSTNLEVIPLKNLKEPCYLVFFEETGRSAFRSPAAPSAGGVPTTSGKKQKAGSGASAELRRRIAELEQELVERNDYLQSFQEQSEAAHEEFQASNEEVTSANEELQSVNEELESSKEEIESASEELTTLNEELASRNSALGRINDDLTNLQTSAHLAIVLLGRDQTIRRFSAKAGTQFNLVATDVGRPFDHIRHNLDVPELDKIIARVIATFREHEQEVQSKEGHWFSLRVRPYVTVDQQIDGAVLVLTDIDAIKRSQQEIATERDYAEAIMRAAPDPLIILSADLRVETANEAFYTTFKVSPVESKGHVIYDLGNGQWNMPRLRQLLAEILPRDSVFNNYEIVHDFEHIGRRVMMLNARTLGASGDRAAKILLGIRDETELLHFQAEMRRSELRYRRLFEAARDGVLLMDPFTRKIVDANPFMTELLGYARDELIGKELFEIGLLKDEAASRAMFRELQETSYNRHEDLPLETKTGKRREVELVSNVYDEDDEKIIQCNVRDITERKHAENAMRESEDRFRVLFELGPVAVYSCDASGVIREFNGHAVELWGRKPEQGDTDERFCGSFKLFRPDGSFMPHEQCPMAEVVSGKIAETRDAEVLIERPNGSRVTVVVNIRPLKNRQGEVIGAINCFYDITTRKQAEDALRQNEALFSALIDQAPGGVYVVDAQFRLQRVNAQALPVFDAVHPRTGRDFSEVLDILWGPEVGGQIERIFRHTLETGERYSTPDLSGLRPDLGVEKSYEWETQRVTLPDGQHGVVCYFNDITERKRAEEALREAEERYRTLFSSIDEGFCVIEMIFDEHEQPVDYRYLEVNPTFGKQTGLMEATGKLVRELVPDLEAHWFEVFGKVARTGEPVRFVSEAKGLGNRWYDVYACRVGEPESRKVAVVFNDITERRRAEAELRHRGTLLLALSEAAAQLLAADSPHSLLDVIFGRMMRVLGAEYYFTHLFSTDDSKLVLETSGGLDDEMRMAFAELPFVSIPNAARTDSAEPFMTDVAAVCLAQEAAATRILGARAVACHPLWAGHRFHGTFCVASSLRAPFDEEELRFVHTLCDLVAASLERARLIRAVTRARDISERANVAKDMFLASLSHELRTPLTPVLLLAGETADDPAMPDVVREICATITKNVKLEARLIDDLLDITRITHGKMALDLKVVDVHVALRDAIDTVQSELQGKQIALKLNLTAKNPFVMGDTVRLQQIFWNVLRNAVKFSPSGGEIVVKTAVLPSRFLSISITDKGMGITTQELERLFAAFAQGDHANAGGSHRFGGLGLGLSISRMLTERHSGTIRAESAGLNHGSTFIIELPLTEESTREMLMSPAAVNSTDAVNRKILHSGRVLLVEDHGSTRKALEQLLVRRHYEVVPVGSLAAARSAANEGKFDLLISDIGLPDGTGHDLMVELHSRFGLKGIALTGYGMDEDLIRSREAGFITHLTKPISVEALENALAVATSQK